MNSGCDGNAMKRGLLLVQSTSTPICIDWHRSDVVVGAMDGQAVGMHVSSRNCMTEHRVGGSKHSICITFY